MCLLLVGVAGAVTAHFHYIQDPNDPTNFTFTDESIGTPTVRAWFFGDERYNQSWITINDTTDIIGGSDVLPNGTIAYAPGSASPYAAYLSADGGNSHIAVNETGMDFSADGQCFAMAFGGSNTYIVMGGENKRNAWLTVDGGYTWMQRCTTVWGTSVAQLRNAEVIAMHDGSFVTIGGSTGWYGSGNVYNWTWRSTDLGLTWNLMSNNSPWIARSGIKPLPQKTIQST